MEIKSVLTSEQQERLAKWFEEGHEIIIAKKQETKEQKKEITGV